MNLKPDLVFFFLIALIHTALGQETTQTSLIGVKIWFVKSENQHMVINCNTTSPVSTYKWKKNSVDFEGNSRTLTVNKSEINDKDQFQCFDNGAVALYTVDLYEIPKNLLNLQLKNAIEGLPYNITCEILPDMQKGENYWAKQTNTSQNITDGIRITSHLNGTLLFSNIETKDGTDDSNYVYMFHISENDSIPICETQLNVSSSYNDISTNVIVTTEKSVESLFKIEPRLTTEKIIEHQTVEFEFELIDNSSVKINFTFNGKSLSSSPSYIDRMTLNVTKISIANVTKNDSGEYGFIAYIIDGEQRPEYTVNLTVQQPAPLVFTDENQEKIVINVNKTDSTVPLKCPVTSLPPPKITWKKDSEPNNAISDINSDMIISGDNMTLTITNLTFLDSEVTYEYVCIAESEYFNTTLRKYFTLKLPLRPSAPSSSPTLTDSSTELNQTSERDRKSVEVLVALVVIIIAILIVIGVIIAYKKYYRSNVYYTERGMDNGAESGSSQPNPSGRKSSRSGTRPSSAQNGMATAEV